MSIARVVFLQLPILGGRGMETEMVEWLKRLVVGEGNVVRERSYTNWNTLDVSSILSEKDREVACPPASTSESGDSKAIPDLKK